jgi:hypothetical protein
MYAVFVAGVALLLPWLLRHARSLEGACSLMLLAMAGIAGGIVLAAGWPQVKELFTSVADQAATLLSGGTNPSYTGGEATAAEWKQALLAELPSGVAVFSLLVVWINTHFILKLKRLKLTPAFAREWKTPEWLVWPTIVVGAGAVWLPVGPVSMVAINLIRFLFAIYVLQGLSVATFFLDHWRVGGPLRWVMFVGGVVFGAICTSEFHCQDLQPGHAFDTASERVVQVFPHFSQTQSHRKTSVIITLLIITLLMIISQLIIIKRATPASIALDIPLSITINAPSQDTSPPTPRGSAPLVYSPPSTP